jgi:hypothetical protein
MTSVTPVEDLLIRQILFVVTSEVYKVTSQEQVRKGVYPPLFQDKALLTEQRG